MGPHRNPAAVTFARICAAGRLVSVVATSASTWASAEDGLSALIPNRAKNAHIAAHWDS